MGRFCGVFLRIVMIVCGLSLVVAGRGMAGERPSVTGVRIAEHDGITRFVMDLSSSVSFQVIGQSDPGHVVVEFPDLGWGGDSKGLSRPVGVLRNFHYDNSRPGGVRLTLDVGRPVTVQKAFLIPPSAGSSFRLVLDLVAGAPPPAPVPQKTQTAALPVSSGNPILSPPPGAKRTDGDSVAHGMIPPPPPHESAAIPAAAVPDLSVRPSDRKSSHAGKPIVVIDPGHGGVDPGATSVSGVYEKNIVLALARDVKTQLDKGGKVKCILTRDRDVFIPLRERVAIGRAANADLFISLHADTVTDPDIRGLSVYTLSQNASDSEAQALADKENKADIVAGIDLSNESPEVTNILIDLVQRESMNLSAVFAHQLILAVSHETHELLQNTHRFAGFAVLKAPDVPSVLVETGYLSNAGDEQMLRRPEYRAKLAAAMARAIEHYFAQTQKARRS